MMTYPRNAGVIWRGGELLLWDTCEAEEIEGADLGFSVLLGSKAVKFQAETLAGSGVVVVYSTDFSSVRDCSLSMPAAFFNINMDLGMLNSRPTLQPA
jgi:hypothetical protein